MAQNNYFDIFQSGFKLNQSTETTHIKALNDIYVSSDSAF